MRLLLKLNLVFVAVFALGLGITGFVCHGFMLRNAREQIVTNARIMLETAMAMRNYTTNQIAPLLKAQEKEYEALAAEILALDSGAKIPRDTVFHPQSVPAFGATESFNFLRREYPEYTYKEATLNPTNPRDQATDWETDVVAEFRNFPDKAEHIGERDAASGRSLFLARPITIKDASCLECHSTPENAPDAMLKLYGNSNGFNWKLNETVGAQIVTVPMSLPIQMADDAFRALMFSLVGVFGVILAVLNVVVYFTVIQPVWKMTQMADAVSTGTPDVPELPVKGKDEISRLANAFNRMRRSLEKAMQMLGDD
jgi:HAMP domain-containing protein